MLCYSAIIPLTLFRAICFSNRFPNFRFPPSRLHPQFLLFRPDPRFPTLFALRSRTTTTAVDALRSSPFDLQANGGGGRAGALFTARPKSLGVPPSHPSLQHCGDTASVSYSRILSNSTPYRRPLTTAAAAATPAHDGVRARRAASLRLNFPFSRLLEGRNPSRLGGLSRARGPAASFDQRWEADHGGCSSFAYFFLNPCFCSPGTSRSDVGASAGFYEVPSCRLLTGTESLMRAAHTAIPKGGTVCLEARVFFL